ncbi:techylectin-5A-like [Oratosquilla oratoria]|uniref:techylectin-5A-like n=1 Tax=Oratosquilla oratoria TaxID=337810 RepID=UPI003F760373
MLRLIAWIMAFNFKLSMATAYKPSSSVGSLLEEVGFSRACIGHALAQCLHQSNPVDSPSALPILQELLTSIKNLTASVHKEYSTQEYPKPNPSSLPWLPRNCQDLKEAGDEGRGVRVIYPYSCCPEWREYVLCDQVTDGGGWIVIQHRNESVPHEDFYRTWVEYEFGFGDLKKEFWAGLNLLHYLTSESLQELRIELEDFENIERFAKYGAFHIEGARANYKMHISRYSGNAGDSMAKHNGMAFSTYDHDNDQHSHLNCAARYLGAWWHKSCWDSNLNGKYQVGTITNHDGIIWRHFRGDNYSLRHTEMKIRPSFPRSLSEE